MNAWPALIAVLAACWHAWIILAGRVSGAGELLPLLLVGAVLAMPWFGRTLRPVALLPLTLFVACYAAAVLFLPPLLRILPAVLAVAYCLHAAGADGRPPAAFYGLVSLALPIVDSLEFYGAYPVRVVALQATLVLLRMNGVAVESAGLALRFAGDLVEFDAPCSGVRMLWTCWFLASALAWLYRFPVRRYAIALLSATVIAFASNVLRATSLFYLETELFGESRLPWLHEAVGVAAFTITALGV